MYPDVREEDFYGQGQYRIDQKASKTMLNSLMYRLCYYRTHEQQIHPQAPKGYDMVRGVQAHSDPIELEYFEEVFTTERWMLRIYKLKDDPNREPKTTS